MQKYMQKILDFIDKSRTGLFVLIIPTLSTAFDMYCELCLLSRIK